MAAVRHSPRARYKADINRQKMTKNKKKNKKRTKKQRRRVARLVLSFLRCTTLSGRDRCERGGRFEKFTVWRQTVKEKLWDLHTAKESATAGRRRTVSSPAPRRRASEGVAAAACTRGGRRRSGASPARDAQASAPLWNRETARSLN